MQKVKKPKIKEDQSVLVLNKDNFDRALKESKFLLVNFYAPLSGASLTLLTEFEKAAVQLKSEKQVKLSKVDVSTEKDLAKEFGIQDYPVLKLFIRGERKNPLNCTGVSSASSIATWLRRRIGPSATRLLNITHIETFIASEDVVVVGFFKDLKGNSTKTFYETAKDIPDLPFGVTNSTKHFVKYGISTDTIILFRKFEEERLDFKIANGSSLEKDDLTKFIKVNELSLVTEYNQMIIFILVDTDESMNGRLREFFQIRDMDVPAVCLINTTEDVRYRMRADQVTTESVKKFCQDYLNGKEKPQQYSEDLPEDWNKNPVKVLVGSNFDEFVFNTSKSVFVLFCAPWSERCKHINSIWDQLGEKYKDSENIVIAKVDITANDIDSVIIEEYPSVKYFPPGSDRKIVHYTSAQTLNAFSKFLDKQGKSKVRISTMPATVHFI
ncbi:protein disulfide-isomerase-like isoform X2 [Stegostoma tigrinum]|uniref:protein disulfide-isomerase-like isoform X2 n=1 Tax=Stegostoma tigrinum TaxID=3053191 RepID=UPI00286FB5B1|nr:protein disulfide-isomerase-like isoform X2 [Stegostoma tigrinum]